MVKFKSLCGKTKNFFKKAMTTAVTTAMMATATMTNALANGAGGGAAAGGGTGGGFTADAVTVTGNSADAGQLMGQIIGILLTITRFVGVALVIYGVYEIVMSFMQNQPEAKTKGIIMALAGVVMIALKSILIGLGVVS